MALYNMGSRLGYLCRPERPGGFHAMATMKFPPISFTTNPPKENLSKEQMTNLMGLAVNAIGEAKKLLEHDLSTLESEKDLAIPAIQLPPLTIDLGGDKAVNAKTLGAAAADAIRALIPHYQTTGIRSDALAILGAVIPGKSGKLPTDEDCYMFGWELPEADAKALAGYLNATGNPTASQLVVKGHSERKPDMQNITQAFSPSGSPGSLEQMIEGAFSNKLHNNYSATSEQEAKAGALAVAFQSPYLGFGTVGPVGAGKLKDVTELHTYAAKLFGPDGTKAVRDLYDGIDFDFNKVSSRATLPPFRWRMVFDQGAVDTLAREAENQTVQGNYAAVVSLVDDPGKSPIDRARIVFSWRRLKNGSWTAYEVRTLTRSVDPGLYRGVVVQDADVREHPNPAAGAKKAVKKNELVSLAGHANGWWTIGVGDSKFENNYGYLPETAVQPYGSHVELSQTPLFSRTKGEQHDVSPNDIVQGALGSCYFLVALTAVARADPDYVKNMIVDNLDGTVSVRFFKDTGGNTYREEWVRVGRSVPVDPNGRPLYVSNELGGQPHRELWPSLVEKAYASWKGAGWYYNIHYGHTNEAMSEILGRPTTAEVVNISHASHKRFPFELSDPELQTEMPSIAPQDRQRILAYATSPGWAQTLSDLDVKHPGARVDFSWVEGHLSRAKISKAGQAQIAQWMGVGTLIEGGLGSRKYSQDARDLFKKVQDNVDGGKLVALGSKKWGQGGTGKSGGENTDVVDGLASTHAYVVLGYEVKKDASCWINLRNPWGQHGRAYKKRFVFFGGLKVGKTEDANFALELTDVMKFFSTVQATV